MKRVSYTEDFQNILYHGTSSDCIIDLKEGILLEKGLKNLDFGQGFYLTANPKQAKEWAERKARVAAKFKGDPTIRGAVFVYELDIDRVLLEDMRVLIFDGEDAEWAKYVFENRTGNTPVYEELGRPAEIVYGPLADGKTGLLVRQLQEQKIRFSEFRRQLKGYKYPFPKDHQYTFHSERAIRALRLIDVMEV